AGRASSSNAVVMVVPILPLPEALDTPTWTWSTNGNAGWVGQPVVTFDGVDAARSGNILDSQSSTMQTTVNGPGTVSFWWKVSSETNNDQLQSYIGGSSKAAISGLVDWQPRTFPIPSGSQVLKWTYSKN